MIQAKLIGSLVVLAMAPGAWAQDWPQWRGPNRDNKTIGFTAPKTWPKELTKKWTVAVGEGVSSPVLVAGKVFVFAAEGGEEITYCLDGESGKEVWKDKFASKPVTGIASGKGRFVGPRSTPAEFVTAMCKMAKVGKGDVVYDLGCGDGRMVIMAVRDFGAKRGVGIDLDPEMIKQCKENAKKYGVADKVDFRVGDVLKVEDLSEANVVLLYMGDDINQRLKPILQKTLKPGSRVISHRFLMGDDWAPDRSEHVQATIGEYPGYEHDIHLWTIKSPKKK